MANRKESLTRPGLSAASITSRRAFLRGVGTCLALPAMQSLYPQRLFGVEPLGLATQLATTPTGAPLRTAFIYFPNGAIPASWWPEKEGVDFSLSRTLQPLDSLRNSIQILAGLDNVSAEAGPDGAGDHARGIGTFLTSVRLRKSATDVHAGVSIDQVIAKQVGHLTRFPSLELTGDAKRQTSNCDSGYSCAYQYNVSWRSPTSPMTPEANPRLIFERLFGAGTPAERQKNLERRRHEQRSVLDFVMEDAKAWQRRLDGNDREKMEQYLASVREIEVAIETAEKFGKSLDPRIDAPPGIPDDHGAHIGLLFDMLLLAFQTDSTRVASFCLAHDGSNRSFEHIGISEGHHELTHHQNQKDRIAKVQDIDLWYVKQLAKFLAKLDGTKDVDGTSLLHNSMIVYGSGNADANRHTHVNLPIVLAGQGGGKLNSGRYVNHGSAPLANLYLTLADHVGLDKLPRFGDSDGRLPNV